MKVVLLPVKFLSPISLIHACFQMIPQYLGRLKKIDRGHGETLFENTASKKSGAHALRPTALEYSIRQAARVPDIMGRLAEGAFR